MAKVEIYTKFLCGFCVRAKNLLVSKGAEIEEFDITMDALSRRFSSTAAMSADRMTLSRSKPPASSTSG
jgi:glutaredoxin 3